MNMDITNIFVSELGVTDVTLTDVYRRILNKKDRLNQTPFQQLKPHHVRIYYNPELSQILDIIQNQTVYHRETYLKLWNCITRSVRKEFLQKRPDGSFVTQISTDSNLLLP